MEMFGSTHIIFLVLTTLFLVSTMWAVSHMNYFWQNMMFMFATIMCCGSLFFRFAMSNSFNKGVNIGKLVESWLQVCNFNFVLLPLMLYPSHKIARQYSLMFALPSAISGIIGCEWQGIQWYDSEIASYWLYHIFAIALPLWMVASRRLKPQKSDVLKVSLGVFMYFTIVAIILAILVHIGVYDTDIGYSFIYNTSGVGVFEWLYSLIPIPYVYLLPVFPAIVLLFYFVAWCFRKYEVTEYTDVFNMNKKVREQKKAQKLNKQLAVA